MQVHRKKTAIHFHAKDDLPEVRREMFKLLPDIDAKVQVIVRRKSDLALRARDEFRSRGRKTTANEIYDDLVKRLFKNLLHKEPPRIVFVRRGKEARYDALRRAIDRAKSNFERQWGIPGEHPIHIESGYPSAHAGLQIVDYYLWALQRLFERSEDRFFKLLAENYRLIIDLDDKRKRRYGRYYSDSDPLDLAKIKPVEG